MSNYTSRVTCCQTMLGLDSGLWYNAEAFILEAKPCEQTQTPEANPQPENTLDHELCHCWQYDRQSYYRGLARRLAGNADATAYLDSGSNKHPGANRNTARFPDLWAVGDSDCLSDSKGNGASSGPRGAHQYAWAGDCAAYRRARVHVNDYANFDHQPLSKASNWFAVDRTL
jgi:hypothetical protein